LSRFPYIIAFLASLISREQKVLTADYLDGTIMGMDHRWGQRQSTDLTVLVARSGLTGIARVVNVSVTGAYLETRVSLRLHSLVYLQPITQDHAHINANRVAANVVRQDALGVGLEWCEALTKRAHLDALLSMLGKTEPVDCVCDRRTKAAAEETRDVAEAEIVPSFLLRDPSHDFRDQENGIDINAIKASLIML
jgi:hypothetical protein